MLSTAIAYVFGGVVFVLLQQWGALHGLKDPRSMLLAMPMYAGMLLVRFVQPKGANTQSVPQLLFLFLSNRGMMLASTCDVLKDALGLVAVVTCGGALTSVVMSTTVVITAVLRRILVGVSVRGDQAAWLALVSLGGAMVGAKDGAAALRAVTDGSAPNSALSSIGSGILFAFGASLLSSTSTVLYERMVGGGAACPTRTTALAAADVSFLTGALGMLGFTVYTLLVSVHHWQEWVLRELWMSIAELAVLLCIMVAVCTVSNWGYFGTVATAGATTASVLRTLRTAMLIGVSALLFCSKEHGVAVGCMERRRALASVCILCGVLGYAVATRDRRLGVNRGQSPFLLALACAVLIIVLHGSAAEERDEREAHGLSATSSYSAADTVTPMRRVVFIDIDDTLSATYERDRRHRRADGSLSPAFFSSAQLRFDGVIAKAPETVQRLYDAGYLVHIISARGGASFERDATLATEQWLRKARIPFDRLTLVSASDTKPREIVRLCREAADSSARTFYTERLAHLALEEKRVEPNQGAHCVLIDDVAKGAPPRLVDSALRAYADDMRSFLDFTLFNRTLTPWSSIAERIDERARFLRPRVPTIAAVYEYTDYGAIFVVRALRAGLHLAASHRDADVLWVGKSSMRNRERCMAAAHLTFADGPRAGQHANVINGVAELLDQKAELAANMQRIGSPHVPPTYTAVAQRAQLQEAVRAHPDWSWLMKNDAAPNGRSVHVLERGAELAHIDKLLAATPAADRAATVVQRYIERPFLVGARKVDVRVYGLVPDADPLSVYVHRHGYWRGAAHNYIADLSDNAAHITNIERYEGGAPLTHTGVRAQRFLDAAPVTEEQWRRAGRNVVNATRDVWLSVADQLGCGESRQTERYGAAPFPMRCARWFQWFNLDVMLDAAFDVHVLELNPDPSPKKRSSKISVNDEEMLRDTLRMLGVSDEARTSSAVQSTQVRVHRACRLASTELARRHCERLVRAHHRRGQYVLAFPDADWRRHRQRLPSLAAHTEEAYDLFGAYVGALPAEERDDGGERQRPLWPWQSEQEEERQYRRRIHEWRIPEQQLVDESYLKTAERQQVAEMAEMRQRHDEVLQAEANWPK